MQTSQRRQTIAPHAHGVLRLAGLIPSPYMAELNGIGSARDIHLSLTTMDFLIDAIGTTAGNPYAIISWWNSSNVFQSSDFIFMTWADVKTNGLSATIAAAVSTYASGNSLTVSSIKGTPGIVQGAPQAAIADATAGAATNMTTSYNTLSGLLGLSSGLNDANTAQNDLATKFNALAAKFNTALAEMRTLGLITV